LIYDLGNASFLKKYNKSKLLNLVRINKTISRTDLSKFTGLSQTAIGTQIAELLNEEFLFETGIGKSRGGRKPILLELKPNSYFSVGVDILADQIRIVVIDLLGNIVFEEVEKNDCCENFSKVFNSIESIISSTVQMLSIPQERLLGISLAIPGAVSNSLHRILFAYSLNWKNISVPKNFGSMPEVKIVVENDANACAVFENWIGSCQGLDNFVCIMHRTGIGAGVFIKGTLYRGSNGFAAQIGHIQVDENGPLCKCGNYGCLEVMAAESYILSRMKKKIRQGIVKIKNVFNIEDVDFNIFLNEVRGGNKIAMNLLSSAAANLGIGISILINILNPTNIVFSVGYNHYPETFIDQINNIAKDKVLDIYRSKIKISQSKPSKSSIAIGAAIIPLKSLFGEDIY